MPIAWTIALGTKIAGAKIMPRSCWHEDCYGAPPSVSPSVSTTYARRGPKQVPCQVQVGTKIALFIYHFSVFIKHFCLYSITITNHFGIITIYII